MGKKKKNSSKSRGMSDSELLGLIGSRKSNGINAEGGDITNARQYTFNRYLGRPYGDEQEGLSQVVSRDMLDTVEWAMPGLMKVFTGDDLTVIFEADGPEDEAAALQETEYTNYVFMKQNDGFVVLHNLFKDSLLSPTAYAKVWYEENEEVTTEPYSGLLAGDLADLDADEELEPVEQEMYDEVREEINPLTGQVEKVNVTLYDVVYKRRASVGKCKVESIPPEELIIDEKVTGLDLSEADFLHHTTQKSKKDLIDMGFDKKIVNSLSSPDHTEREETENRREYEDEDDYDTNDEEGMLSLEDTYIVIDREGTGMPERWHIMAVGDTILLDEPDDYVPFIAQSSVIIPHRHTGVAYADLVEDIQRIKTTLTRQMLNNLYRVNNPRPIVGLGVNMQDLLNDAPNAPIRARDITDIRMEPTQAVIDQVLPTLDYFNTVQTSRSGVGAHTKGLDADVLAESTRGAYLGSLEQSNQRLEMVARIFAETGVKQIFLKIHELILRYQKKVVDFKIRGEWVKVNPTEWKTRRNMTVSVGIGYGTKEQHLFALDKIEEAQRVLAMNGSPLVQPDNIFALQSKKVDLAGAGDPEKYFTNPANLTPEQLNPPTEGEGDALAAAQMAMAEVENKKIELEHQRSLLEMEQKNFKLEQELAALQGKLMIEARKLQQGDRKLDQEDRKIDNDEVETILDAEYKEATLEASEQKELNSRQEEYYG